MKRIKMAKISHISLVPRGANHLPVIYKAEDETVTFESVVSKMDERGLLTSLVYVPEKRDTHGDIASAEVIEKMAHDFLAGTRQGSGVDVRHDGRSLTEGTSVIESYIVKKGDHSFDGLTDFSGNPVNAEGAWAVTLKIEDPELRRKYREGEWNGISMGGAAALEIEKEEDSQEGKLLKFFKGLLSGDKKGDSKMEKEEIQALIKEGVESALAEHTKIAKQEGTENDEIVAPVFKGDYSNPDDMKNFAKEMKIYEARKECGDDFDKLLGMINKINEEFAEDLTELHKMANVKKGDSKELIDAKVALFKAEQASKQPAADNGEGGDGNETFQGISKEDARLLKAGQAAGKATVGTD